MDRFKSYWRKLWDDKPAKRKSRSQKQLRLIVNKALAYSLAFLFTYLVSMIISIRTLLRYESGPVLSVIARILFPLQGFFNFIVFIYSKVTHEHEKKSNGDISWCMAFVKAVQSRGPRQKRLKINSARNKLRGGLDRFVGKVKHAMNKKTKSSPETEEEKCEIVPSLPVQTSDLTPRQGSSTYVSSPGSPMHPSYMSYNPVSRGDVESGLSQQQHSSIKEEEKCEDVASQPNSPMHTSNRGDSI